MKNIGIVLKTFFPSKQKVLVLDRNLGKIFLISKNQNNLLRLCNGVIFEYNLESINDKNLIVELDIIKFPNVGKNILFFHHILELYNFFIPIGFMYCQLFDLLCSIYDLLEQENITKKEQKLFLYQFFSLMGMCPRNEKEYGLNSIDLDDENFLEKWINACINSHPQVNLLKTKIF